MKKYSLRSLFILTFIVAFLLAIAKQWPFVNSNAINQLRDGMTKAEVVSLLGEPYSECLCSPETYCYVYGIFPTKVLVVEFDLKTKRVVSFFRD